MESRHTCGDGMPTTGARMPGRWVCALTDTLSKMHAAATHASRPLQGLCPQTVSQGSRKCLLPAESSQQRTNFHSPRRAPASVLPRGAVVAPFPSNGAVREDVVRAERSGVKGWGMMEKRQQVCGAGLVPDGPLDPGWSVPGWRRRTSAGGLLDPCTRTGCTGCEDRIEPQPGRGQLRGQPDWNGPLFRAELPQSSHSTAQPGFPGKLSRPRICAEGAYRPAQLRATGQQPPAPARGTKGWSGSARQHTLSVHPCRCRLPLQTCAVSSVQGRRACMITFSLFLLLCASHMRAHTCTHR